MPTLLQRKRRANEDGDPPPPQRRRSEVDQDASASDSQRSASGAEDGEESVSAGAHQQMVKKLVRLALSSEYSRQPIRRSDISLKVLSNSSSRHAFKDVFADAQKVLRKTFGMELRELPLKDKVTVAQKRAAYEQAIGKANAAPTTSKSYILISTLPLVLRSPAILPPSRVPDVHAEAAFEGFVSFVVSLLYLSEGQRVSEGKLLRHLRTCNADDLVLGAEKTEVVLKRLERQGYIVKIKERDEAGGEESIDYVLGPRAKLEIGPEGVAGLVRSIYGKRDTELEDLENQLEVSLGKATFQRKSSNLEDAQAETTNAEAAPPDDSLETQGRRGERRRGEATYERRQTRRSRHLAGPPSEEESE